MKKIISLALCLMMVLAMAAPVFAADPTYTLTINNATKDHTYEAYQIFSGKLEDVPNTNPVVQVLTDIEWGASVTNGTELLAAIVAAAKAADAPAPLKTLAGAKDAANLAELISDNITSDSESLDALAEIFGKFLKTSPIAESSYVEASGEVPAHYTISGLSAGYYLVKDKDNSLNNVYDSYTKFILRVIKNESVTPKSAVPSVDKEISDQLADNYGEVKDFDINDSAYYKWTGHLPSNLSDYEAYHYKFYDTLPKGIQHVKFEQIYLVDKDNNTVRTWMDLHDSDEDNNVLPEGITQTVTPNADGTTLITLEFADLIALYPDILADQKIVVKYSAFITRDAVMAEPMTNSVYVEYDNDPNGTGEGHFGKTPEDVAHAFTFGVNVDKYDADNKSTKLPGAEFVLYYTKAEKNEQTGETENVNYYAKVITKAFLDANPGYELNGRPITEADRGVVYGWTKVRDEASTLTTNENGQIALRGLDAGIYYLQETKAPAGYNLMETPVKVEIAPAYDKDGNMTSVEYKVDDIKQETNTVGVRNSSGSTLPVTGGIGTTLFYVFGGIMVLAAVVLLVTKKRMAS